MREHRRQIVGTEKAPPSRKDVRQRPFVRHAGMSGRLRGSCACLEPMPPGPRKHAAETDRRGIERHTSHTELPCVKPHARPAAKQRPQKFQENFWGLDFWSLENRATGCGARTQGTLFPARRPARSLAKSMLLSENL
jgi:hypothetical protein